MKRFRIGLDAHVLNGKPQGSRTALLHLLRTVSKLDTGHEFVIYSENAEACAKLLGAEQFQYRQLPRGGSYRRLLAFPKLMKKDNIDLSVFQYISPPFCDVPSLVMIHDILPISHPQLFPTIFALQRRGLYTLSISRANVLITVSETVRQQISSYFPRVASRVHVVPNGPSFAPDVYFEGSPPASISSLGIRLPYILAVGRIEARKNIDLLARAFVAANVANTQLVVVGHRDLGFSGIFLNDKRILCLERINDAQLIDIFRGASLFAFPSKAEGFGIPLLDALLFGIPTISSNQTAMPEVAGDLATYFDPTSSDVEFLIADLIRCHFGNRPIAAPSIEQRRKHAAKFSWDSNANKFLAIIDSALGGRAKGPL
jgi:glycosyltransferase involved in cell wall biosynthesis